MGHMSVTDKPTDEQNGHNIMRHVTVCSSVCMSSVTLLHPAKAAKAVGRNVMPFGRDTHCVGVPVPHGKGRFGDRNFQFATTPLRAYCQITLGLVVCTLSVSNRWNYSFYSLIKFNDYACVPRNYEKYALGWNFRILLSFSWKRGSLGRSCRLSMVTFWPMRPRTWAWSDHDLLRGRLSKLCCWRRLSTVHPPVNYSSPPRM